MFEQRNLRPRAFESVQSSRDKMHGQISARMRAPNTNRPQLELGGSKMGASDLPLEIRQRIERRWSFRIKRDQQPQPRDPAVPSSMSSPEGVADAPALISEWRKPRSNDG